MQFRRKSIARHLHSALTLLVALAAIGLVSFGSMGAAAAQEAPLKMVFVNSDPMDGTAVYDALAEVLEASSDLQLVDPGDLLAAGSERGIGLDTLRDGDKRLRHRAEFAAMLSQTGGEAILVLDVFGGGNTMQLVVIGPYGNELDDIRQSIAGSRPSQSESVTVLKQAFKALVPKVRQYREEQAQRQEQQAGVDLVGEEEPPSDSQKIKERVIREHREKHADLKTGLTPHVGMIFGRRSLQLETQADYQLDHASPFVGFGAEVDIIFALMDGDTAAFGATVFGSFAPFTTVFTNDQGQPVELPSAFSNVGGDFKYLKGVGADLIVFGKAGVELMSIQIDQNQAYTGNDYINMRAGAGLVYQFGELAELHLDAAALPVVDARLSGDVMGPADFGLGWNAAAKLQLTFLKPFEVAAGYDFQYYPTTFSQPVLEDLGGQPATTTDMFHLANVMVGYGF
ncbi:hypothetical protein FIV42_12125 [Persicimonas caeni]|uniref:Uncharacterized protein n=1 Tax=Persicimonas caeni TaxID=2292766 RepID=A0A4Y6PT01_PERCE|nr:hypothetical protein [Persicimonas caeni]QDG51464.1 hypothetical protein FIV42_12125 [Persicimonas caeni]QED32685.1 hypothetical protein FRD00_12120 [Persicimonas caeni]